MRLQLISVTMAQYPLAQNSLLSTQHRPLAYRLREEIRTAQNMFGSTNCVPAIEVITFQPHLAAVMGYVFGSVLVYSSATIAHAVSSNPHINAECIALDGTYADEVSLTGGFSEYARILHLVPDFQFNKRRLNGKYADLCDIDKKIAIKKTKANALRCSSNNLLERKCYLEQLLSDF